VGEIKMVGIDPNDTTPEGKDGCLFSLELNTRIYTLRAKSETEADAWVKVLKKLQAEGSTTNNPMSSSARMGKERIRAAENGMGATDWKKTEKWKVMLFKICPCLG
jgi:hypothetical protein